MKQATIRILDEVNVVITGMDTRDIEFFYDRFGIHAKGYVFSPKYKIGAWDGKIRFFSKQGRTYVQLLPEIVKLLQEFQYKLDLEDNRKYHNIDIPKIDNNFLNDYPDPMDPSKPLILADHQVQIINTLSENSNGIVVAGTNAGKSICIAVLLRLYKQYCNYKCLVIVPTKDLVRQTHKNIATYGNDTGIYYGNKKDIDHDHVVSTWQSLKNNKSLIGQFKVIIVDECHGTRSAQLRTICNEDGANAAVKVGVTGTLPESPDERMNVRISLGNVLLTIPSSYLIEIGWSATLHLRAIQLEEDFNDKWNLYQIEYPEEATKLTYNKFKDNYFPEYKNEMDYLKSNERRNEFIVDIIETAKEVRGSCLVLVNGVAYGQKLASMIPGAHFIYGKDKDKVRDEIYQMYAEHDNIVLITSYQIASTGLSINRIFNMFMIDAEKSFIRVIQSIGRGLRKAADKDAIHVYDVGSDLKSSKTQMADRKRMYKKENYKFTFEKIDYNKILTQL